VRSNVYKNYCVDDDLLSCADEFSATPITAVMTSSHGNLQQTTISIRSRQLSDNTIFHHYPNITKLMTQICSTHCKTHFLCLWFARRHMALY